jgi:hypothetical protein
VLHETVPNMRAPPQALGLAPALNKQVQHRLERCMKAELQAQAQMIPKKK